MYNITFKPTDNPCQINNGDTLMDAAIKLGIPIDGNCSSAGVCGKCKVKVLEGNGNDLTEEEERLLSSGEKREGYRLACKFIPKGDVTVEVSPQGSGAERKASLISLPEFWEKEDTSIKQYITLPENSIDDQVSELDKIKRTLGRESLHTGRDVLSELQHILQERRDITVVIIGDELVGVEPADTTSKNYGIAFDIGTTTVVGILWDLNTAKMIGSKAMTNPQGVYGADVISRITYV